MNHGGPHISVFQDPAAVAQAVADAVVADAQDAIAKRGAFFIALAGGTTPKAAYELLARDPRRRSVDWPHVFVYFGDERCVGPEDPQSNFRMANEALLAPAGVPPENVHRMRGEDPPAKAARDYAALLVETMGDDPVFDLILLGMGPDGHTASLFPGEDPLTGDDLLVRDVYVEKLDAHRITLTPHVINHARHVVLAVEGEPKSAVLHAVLDGPRDPSIHPVQIVAPRDGRLSWYVDRAAAGRLHAR